jgi:glycosyltransferase involved in cell wall biosynthesis
VKVLLLSTNDLDGGAARAAYRLHQGLQLSKISSQILVQAKSSDAYEVIAHHSNFAESISSLRSILNRLPLKLFHAQRQITPFSVQWLSEGIAKKVDRLSPDIVNLHWICEGFVQIETLSKIKRPIIWTLHDMWAFTGGCHYSYQCVRYKETCGHCPQLNSFSKNDCSYRTLRRKSIAWKNLDLRIVTPSSWLADCALESTLFKDFEISVIPNGIDLQIYKPCTKYLARQLLNLPQDKYLILFGAVDSTSDSRKGFYLLQSALQTLKQIGWEEKVELVIFGSSSPKSLTDLGFKTTYLGKLSDDVALAITYNAVDVFAAPSMQDNLPNTVLEAISCGTPCVAFNIGGMSDLIEHQTNGYLVNPFDIQDFANGLRWILADQERWQKLSEAARFKAEKEFSLELQASRYETLFYSAIESSCNTISG